MSDWKERLEVEKLELDLKIDKLRTFLYGLDTNTMTITIKEYTLLNIQFEQMNAYSNTLFKRIENLEVRAD